MRNILEKVRKRDYEELKRDAQAIYLAASRAHAVIAFRRFRARWLGQYLWCCGWNVICQNSWHSSAFRHLWRKLRTTNVIGRCFIEVRGRTRPMVWFVNVQGVDRIIYSSRDSTWNGKTAPSSYLDKQLDITFRGSAFDSAGPAFLT